MAKINQEEIHLGAMGINSPGYAPRFGTPEWEEAAKWTKEYWDKLNKAHDEHVKNRDKNEQ